MDNYSEIEKKWQKFWQENETFKASNKSDKEKYYILVEFPYPSGSGLHVGHIRSYTALDAMARLKRMQGFNVLFPMGWDAFGAPAEKYAIDNKVHPQDAVKECIRIFKGQMQTLGFSFDWSREFSTTDPDYYKWTQWQFLKFFEQGMAYKAKKEINWCPNCEMGLSNEDSAGGVCERCGSKVEKREKEQWMLKMKDYAESLLDGLGDTEFVDRVKTAQINWIGKSEGAYVNFKIKDSNDVLKVFTTRSDTLYGVTFMVMSPEHSFVEKYQDRIKNMAEVRAYQKEAQEKSEIERTDATKEKTGVKLDGFVVINPVNNQEIPVWISDYVLANYGTGAIMAVPAHDDRDFAFATKFGIPVVQVIERITGKIREDEKKKESIVAVVYNPQNKKYLTINWHDKGGRLFIGGTIKDGETPVECALREIEEETGYTDLKLLNEGFKINHHYYAFNKNQAFNIEATPIYFELLSEKNADTNLDDDEVFDVEWALEKVVQNEVLDELHHACYEGIKEPFYCGDGIHINSDIINGLNNETALETMNKYLVDNGIGEPTTTYRLDDWIFSRQRFWGEPIPLIHCEEHGWVAVPKEDLPVLLPDVVNYEPTKDGESPLANIKEWVLAPCPICGKTGHRETDTMPNWAGSSWYWLRYMNPKNEQEFADMEAMKYWGQVDYYNGGMEHAARHLLYARFWNQFMYDQGLVAVREPFLKRVAHGMILGENSEKMSKSKGNVVNPDDMVREYGADALRIYEMFIGDYEKDASWSENGLKGCKRFLDRVYRLKEKIVNGDNYSKDLENIIHKTIKKVTEDILTMNYNTAISSLMILVNTYDAKESITKGDYQVLLTLLNPVAPHLTEELNELCGFKDIICNRKWPEYNEAKLIDDTVTIAVSVNGKLRATIEVVVDMPQNELISLAKKQENVQKFIDNKEIVKEIVVPNKIVNIVVK